MQQQSQSNSSYYTPAGMPQLTPEGRQILGDVAQRHGFSFDAVLTMFDAVRLGGGSQAQFNQWECGGMGQWSRGGMIMIGDMFNNGLKARVDSLCVELSNLIGKSIYEKPAPMPSHNGVSFFVQGGGSQWPAEFGSPSSSGAQNNLSYAFFPSAARLCIRQNGNLRVFNTGSHQISGVGQQQSGDQSLTFTSQYGYVRLYDLPEINMGQNSPPQNQNPAPFIPQPEPSFAPTNSNPPMANSPASTGGHDVMQLIERLADLHKNGVLTNEEFAQKKSELLSRL